MRNSLFAATEWITRFAYVNLLWIAFTILGLGIFGLFPATVAMFTLIRQWIMGNTDQPVFAQFWETYKAEFWKSNLFGLIFYALAIIFFINFQFIQYNQEGLLGIIKIPLYLFMLAVSLTLIYIIPTFVHYDVRFIDVWKNAFFIMLIHPLHNIAMLAGTACMLYVMWLIPGSLFFFGASLPAYIIMGTTYHTFKKVAAKQEQL
ncbi:YesL family protein [Gracilibacillus caseinilyticus]|uniref:YesL family protein n=1 Tax=Gracilibacillus caseinilyticus TaxID=2932256 RepID=A0ABY4F090_9BACI|nr:YesL family protein [Gracilibacillus caseinilyticus]UOQ50079.1 YesL family protein [Gracilibacillus caseinilyticus]